MTAEEAKAEQEKLAKHYRLSYWFGVNCIPCCGVFPKFMASFDNNALCWYECPVCGKRTERKAMPWLAEKDWNAGKFAETQTVLEGFA